MVTAKLYPRNFGTCSNVNLSETVLEFPSYSPRLSHQSNLIIQFMGSGRSLAWDSYWKSGFNQKNREARIDSYPEESREDQTILDHTYICSRDFDWEQDDLVRQCHIKRACIDYHSWVCLHELCFWLESRRRSHRQKKVARTWLTYSLWRFCHC